MLRKLGNVLVAIWIFLVGICRSILGRNRTKTQSNPQNSVQQQEWKTDWDGWEGVVKIETPPTKEEEQKQQEEVPDLFRDMEPNLVKTKKIKVKRKNESTVRPNLKQFAIDPTYQSSSVTSELLDWPDEEGEGEGEGEGWEREELPELLKQSRESLRQQRLVAMETQRAQLKSKASTGAGPLLGATKIKD